MSRYEELLQKVHADEADPGEIGELLELNERRTIVEAAKAKQADRPAVRGVNRIAAALAGR